MSSSQLLSQEDLVALTGAKQPARQSVVLERHGIYYIKRIDGTITTTWDHVNKPNGGTVVPDNEPDFDKIA